MLLYHFFTQHDEELAENILKNTRRYSKLFSDSVFDLLPDYKQREVQFNYSCNLLTLMNSGKLPWGQDQDTKPRVRW